MNATRLLPLLVCVALAGCGSQATRGAGAAPAPRPELVELRLALFMVARPAGKDSLRQELAGELARELGPTEQQTAGQRTMLRAAGARPLDDLFGALQKRSAAHARSRLRLLPAVPLEMSGLPGTQITTDLVSDNRGVRVRLRTTDEAGRVVYTLDTRIPFDTLFVVIDESPQAADGVAVWVLDEVRKRVDPGRWCVVLALLPRAAEVEAFEMATEK